MADQWVNPGCVNRGMDKRKVCVFLILVGVAILCLCVLVYTLFYANPHTNPTIEKEGHSLLRQNAPSLLRASVEARPLSLSESALRINE
ncbi:MAG TPA: hypothetical protein VGG80_06040 [Acidobacteriaceae bacterium]|jgi:hypothetical protein